MNNQMTIKEVLEKWMEMIEINRENVMYYGSHIPRFDIGKILYDGVEIDPNNITITIEYNNDK